MITRITMTLLLAIVLSLAVGCGDDDKPTESTTGVPNQLVGTWIFQSASIGGMPIGLESLLPFDTSTVTARIKINTNGSYLYENLAADSSIISDLKGKFVVNGSSFVTTDNPDLVLGGTWAVDGTELTLSTDVGDYQLVIIATR